MILTTEIGSMVRLAMEWEKSTLTIKKAVLIIISGITTSYLFYLANLKFAWLDDKFLGFPCIISGIIAVELVKFFVEFSPKLAEGMLRNWLNIRNKNNDHNNDNYPNQEPI